MSLTSKLRLGALKVLLEAKMKDFFLSDPGEFFGSTTGGALLIHEPLQQRLM